MLGGFYTHSTARKVAPPRASQCMRAVLSSVLVAFPFSVKSTCEAPADPEPNGDEKEADTAAFFSSFVVCVSTLMHELVSTVLCKCAPSKVVRVNMVPVAHENCTRFNL